MGRTWDQIIYHVPLNSWLITFNIMIPFCAIEIFDGQELWTRGCAEVNADLLGCHESTPRSDRITTCYCNTDGCNTKIDTDDTTTTTTSKATTKYIPPYTDSAITNWKTNHFFVTLIAIIFYKMF